MVQKTIGAEEIDGNPIVNLFQKGDEDSFPFFVVNENGDVAGGVTSPSNDEITMNERHDRILLKIHEVFHTLFFDNDDAKDGIGSYKNTQMPNQRDINQLINNPDLPKVEIKNKENETN